MAKTTRDFFISFNQADRAWAEWIAWTLEEAGYSVVFQPWDFPPGSHFVLEMQRAAAETGATLAVLSDDYLRGNFTQPEWAAAFARDAQGRERRLVPVRVRACQPTGLLATIVYADLAGMTSDDKDQARDVLLRAVSKERPKPAREPGFPGGPARPATPARRAPAPFPGVRIDTTRLPVPGPHFVGRADELARLDAAWADPRVHVLSVVAFGGVGKSALVFRWLEALQRDQWRGAARVLAWSFYSQGTEERLASADAFIDFALRWCGDPDPTLGLPRDRGLRLAELLRGQRTLLILDGLEPLQHPPATLAGGARQAGRLKDPGLAALLKTLARAHDGLCLLTTRERVAELAPHEHAGGSARLVEPERLSAEDGATLLHELGVRGREAELRAAANEFAGHALTLTLLGSYLRDACGGDVRRRGEIALRTADAREGGGHAFRVMAAYEQWLGEGAELAVLRLLGLFDRPATGALVAALRAAPPIAGLTEALVPLSSDEWQWALTRLRERGLLGAPDAHDREALDAHPLVRAYFAERLERERPAAWRAGHLRLYEHLCHAAPDQPDTLDEMLPLFQAVLHGCRAGRVQEALEEVYWRRVLRRGKHYSWNKLGTFGAELAALAGFFERPWDRPSPQLTPADQAFVLNQAGLYLRALGRLREALQPMKAGLDAALAQEDWRNAAQGASSLGEKALTLGDVTRAVAYGRQGVELADRSGDWGRRVMNRTTLADALHQAGEREEGAALFREAEALQAASQPQNPRLYSLQGYQCCDLLLSVADPDDGSALDGVMALSPGHAGRPSRYPSPAGAGEGSAGGDSAASAALQAVAGANVQRYHQACREVRDRATYALAIAQRNHWLLDIALNHLSLGRAHLGLALTAHLSPAAPDDASTGAPERLPPTAAAAAARRGDPAARAATASGASATAGDAGFEAEFEYAQAAQHLDHAVEGLRKAGQDQEVPRGLIARAAFHRLRAVYAAADEDARQKARAAAEADLTEAHDIATYGEMRLYLADTHLEWTRLHLDHGETEEARRHHDEARRLVAETGYHRRDREVASLARRLSEREAERTQP